MAGVSDSESLPLRFHPASSNHDWGGVVKRRSFGSISRHPSRVAADEKGSGAISLVRFPIRAMGLRWFSSPLAPGLDADA